MNLCKVILTSQLKRVVRKYWGRFLPFLFFNFYGSKTSLFCLFSSIFMTLMKVLNLQISNRHQNLDYKYQKRIFFCESYASYYHHVVVKVSIGINKPKYMNSSIKTVLYSLYSILISVTVSFYELRSLSAVFNNCFK
jgi:hypothetical protein